MNEHHTDRPIGAADGDEQARQRIEELLDALEDVTRGLAPPYGLGIVYSAYSPVVAKSLRVLAKNGAFKIVSENARNVSGAWIPAADRLPPAPSPSTSQAAAADVDRRCAGFAFERFGLPRGSH